MPGDQLPARCSLIHYNPEQMSCMVMMRLLLLHQERCHKIFSIVSCPGLGQICEEISEGGLSRKQIQVASLPNGSGKDFFGEKW